MVLFSSSFIGQCSLFVIFIIQDQTIISLIEILSYYISSLNMKRSDSILLLFVLLSP